MRFLGACVVFLCCVSTAMSAPDEKVMGEAAGLRDMGEFEKATRVLQAYLEQTSGTLEHADRRTVEFEIERMHRIRLDYRLTRDKLLEQVRKRVPDITDEEFDRYEREGLFDVMMIDGHKYYFNSSCSNLLLRVPELQKRETDHKPAGTLRKLYSHMQSVRETRKKTRDPLVCPQDFQVTYTLTVHANAAPAGKTIRCWLPYVRAFPFQTDAHILRTEPGDHLIAPPDAAHRTVYLEKVCEKDVPTSFELCFVYRCWARDNDPIDPQSVQAYHKEGPEYQFYTSEKKPQIDFSNEELRKLSTEIVNGETNPYRVARRLYEWIAQNCIYQYAREYSTLDNIPYYVYTRRAGDCGQHAMLFIELCRMNGIPARWQSGWESFEAGGSGCNMHDWCEFYVEPFGWLPADPDLAVIALHSTDGELNTTQTRELASWYFGNQDHFRLAVNSDFSAPLYPAKNDFRSETVDFQRGEVEYDDVNLYFDKWSYCMAIQPISSQLSSELVQGITRRQETVAVNSGQTTAGLPADAGTSIVVTVAHEAITSVVITEKASTSGLILPRTAPPTPAPVAELTSVSVGTSTPAVTPAPSPTATPVPTPTQTPTPAPTQTPVATPVPTPTPNPTPFPTSAPPAPTSVPTQTATPASTPAPSPTATPVPTPTQPPTPAPTQTPVATPVPTPTPNPTPSPTATPSHPAAETTPSAAPSPVPGQAATPAPAPDSGNAPTPNRAALPAPTSTPEPSSAETSRPMTAPAPTMKPADAVTSGAQAGDMRASTSHMSPVTSEVIARNEQMTSVGAVAPEASSQITSATE